MATLTDELKTFIVQRLAMYDTPQTVAEAVKEEFGVEVDRRQVQMYDPERAGQKPAAKWCALHEATRAAFLKSTATIGVSRRSVRLRRLERMADKAERAGNMVLAAQLLEQIAKEVGGAYTNRRVLKGDKNAPLYFELDTKPPAAGEDS